MDQAQLGSCQRRSPTHQAAHRWVQTISIGYYVTYDPKDASFSGVSDLSSGNYRIVRPKKRVHHKSRDVSQDWDEARYEQHMDKLHRIAKNAGPTGRRIARGEIRANNRKYAKKYNMPGTKAERNNTTMTFNDAIGRNSHFFLRD